MDKITVYFHDCRAVTFDRDKVAFCSGDGMFFDFCGEEKPEEMKRYSALVRDGKALVNWDNVCFVKEHTERDDDL